MIASVRGRVEHVGLDAAVLEAAGLGYRIHATPGTLATLRDGAEVTLATTLVVREDSMTLFGFADDEERDIFELLQTVSGVGPRLALAMLAVHTPNGLRRAVAGEDLKALTRVPGIGEKGARRIVLELGDRLGPASEEGTRPAPTPAGSQADVVAALVGLGWAPKQAEAAVDKVLAAGGVDEADTGAVLRAALQQLGGSTRG
ncbi:Holliday junction branch migration protein RuvA [Occultella glacieicola]|uniref:Holliday junction branch migration complex subunit RuvA n=1 Tax=Occultella glacieicola TaxID=2518684 RepID=A0ABY2E2S3_9MICO|nr:Holliday junction branch migration protein RuvA [Occultella glacieicola]TDE92461.1 Holliday junction branch migration protein RuvA [Occultella glacieicola]